MITNVLCSLIISGQANGQNMGLGERYVLKRDTQVCGFLKWGCLRAFSRSPLLDRKWFQTGAFLRKLEYCKELEYLGSLSNSFTPEALVTLLTMCGLASIPCYFSSGEELSSC